MDYTTDITVEQQRVSQQQFQQVDMSSMSQNDIEDLEDIYFHSIGIFCKSDLYKTDTIWMISQIFLAIGLSFGVCTSILCWSIAILLPPTSWNWKCISILSSLTCVIQIPVFLLYDSTPCKLDVSHQCKIRTGCFLLICSCVLYITVTFITQWIDPPNWVPEANIWKSSYSSNPKSRLTNVVSGGMSWIDSKYRRQYARYISSNTHSEIQALPKDNFDAEENLLFNYSNSKSDAVEDDIQKQKNTRSWLPNFSSYQEIKEDYNDNELHELHDFELDEEEGQIHDVYHNTDLMLHIQNNRHRPHDDKHSYISNVDTFDDSLSFPSENGSTNHNDQNPTKKTISTPKTSPSASSMFPIQEVHLEKDNKHPSNTMDCENSSTSSMLSTPKKVHFTKDAIFKTKAFSNSLPIQENSPNYDANDTEDDNSSTYASARSNLSSHYSNPSKHPTPISKANYTMTRSKKKFASDRSYLSDTPPSIKGQSYYSTKKKSNIKLRSSSLDRYSFSSPSTASTFTFTSTSTPSSIAKMKHIGAKARLNHSMRNSHHTSKDKNLDKIETLVLPPMKQLDQNQTKYDGDNSIDLQQKTSMNESIIQEEAIEDHEPIENDKATSKGETLLLSEAVKENMAAIVEQRSDESHSSSVSNVQTSVPSESPKLTNLIITGGYNSEAFRSRGRELRLKRLTSSSRRKKNLNPTESGTETESDVESSSNIQQMRSWSDSEGKNYSRVMIPIPSMKNMNRNWVMDNVDIYTTTKGKYNRPPIVPFESMAKRKFYTNQSTSAYYCDTSDSDSGTHTKRYDALRKRRGLDQLSISQKQEQEENRVCAVMVTPMNDEVLSDVAEDAVVSPDTKAIVPSTQNTYSHTLSSPIPTSINATVISPISAISPYIREKYEYKPGKSFDSTQKRSSSVPRQIGINRDITSNFGSGKYGSRHLRSNSLNSERLTLPKSRTSSPLSRRYENSPPFTQKSQGNSALTEPINTQAQSQSPPSQRASYRQSSFSERRSRSVSQEARLSRVRRLSEDLTDSASALNRSSIYVSPRKWSRSNHQSISNY